MFKNFCADFKRYRNNESNVLYLFFEQGLWAVAIYRFGRWAHLLRIPVLNRILRLVAFILFKMVEVGTGISIPASAKIGKGCYVGHFGGIIIHSDAKIGENFSVGPSVVIGTRGGGSKGVAVIGDNVYVGVGAKILGPVNIGNNVKVGANAVVVSDVPDGATVIGIPAQIVRKESI